MCTGFSLVGESRGYSLLIVVVHKLLIAVASLLPISGSRTQVQKFWCMGLVAP